MTSIFLSATARALLAGLALSTLGLPALAQAGAAAPAPREDAAAGSAAPPPRVEVPFRRGAIVIDGRLEEREWAGAAELRLDGSERPQVWEPDKRGAWRGPDDLSATFRLCYDSAHFYVAGAIRDDSLVVGGEHQRWEQGDAIELFFDLDLTDDLSSKDGEPPDHRFDRDDVQLFLMPFHAQRRWGVIGWERGGGRDLIAAMPSGANLTGIQVAALPAGNGAWTFEAVLPFHNFFPDLEPGPREIGFNIALDDHDEGSDRYQYMTWTGTNPVTPVTDTRNMGRLRFADSLPLQAVDSAGAGWYQAAAGWLSWIGVPLGVLALLFVLVRGWSALSSQRPQLRPVGRVAGVLALLAGVVLPSWLIGAREQRLQARRDAVVTTLQDMLPWFESGTLASYRGALRDQPLLNLLSGKTVRRKQFFSHRPLAELALGGFGDGPKRYPNEFFQVLPYWIPLPAGQPERLSFSEPLVGRYLYVVVSVPHDRPLEPPPRVRITMRRAGTSEDSAPEVLTFNGPRDSGSVFNQSGRAMLFQQVPLPLAAPPRAPLAWAGPSLAPVEALTLTALDEEGMDLVGLTLVRDEREEARPLYLGEASMGGVETDLRGMFPEDAGVELYSGEQRTVRLLPGRGQGFQKVWLFYRGAYPGQGMVPSRLVPGTRVAAVTIDLEGAEPLVVPLEHQVSMFFEQNRFNQLDRPPAGSAADLAFTWVDQEQEKHVNLVYEVDLPAGATVAGLTFHNHGPYPIRFRSVVFGTEKQVMPADPPGSPLVAAGDSRHVELKKEYLQRLGDASFAIYRDGRLTASNLPGGEREERAVVAKRVLRQLRPAQPFRQSVDQGDARVHEAFVPLLGDGWTGATLGVFLRDDDWQGHVRRTHLAGAVLCLLAAPMLLLLASDLLAIVRSLRLRLLALLSLATLLPLGLLSLLLVRVLENGHESELQGKLQQAMQVANTQLREQQEELLRAARTWAESLSRDLEARLRKLPAGADPAAALGPSLQDTMQSMLPPEWRGGYLKLTYTAPNASPPPPAGPPSSGAPADGGPPAGGAIEPGPAGASTGALVTAGRFQVSVGDSGLHYGETPLRLEPSIYVSWGTPLLGVRCDRELGPASGSRPNGTGDAAAAGGAAGAGNTAAPGATAAGLGTCSLSVARPLDRGLLGSLSPGRGTILCDVRGYPLTVTGGGTLTAERLLATATTPDLLRERRRALTSVVEAGQPVVARHEVDGQRWIGIYDVLRDLQNTPRAMLGLVEVEQLATLPLAFGRVPVRSFFAAGAGLLLLVAIALSLLVTSRIVQPIERLEHAAQAMSRGDLDVRVDIEDSGQIGRLTRTFNRMALDLRGRLEDLRHLNRGIQELTSRLDFAQTLQSSIGFCARHTPADRVRILLVDGERDRVEVHGSSVREVDKDAPDVQALLRASGAVCMRLQHAAGANGGVAGNGGAGLDHRALPRLFPQLRSLIALPLILAGRVRGCILLLFEASAPPPVNLELLATMAAQTAAAIENARLYRHAVQDLHTGAYVPDHFHRLVVQEVRRAHGGRHEVALLGFATGAIGTEGESSTVGSEVATSAPEGASGPEARMERAAALLREALPSDAILCRAGAGLFQVLLPDIGREPAMALAQSALAALRADGDEGWRAAAAAYPADAASAEFLLDALEVALTARDAISDLPSRVEELRRDGITFASAAMQAVLRSLERVAPTDLTILLEGETGTGKEVLTNLIHRWSRRARGPLVKVHCAALPEGLLQSELFGHEKGAFTGAVARRIGKFELAQGGTLFLDEIGEISPDVQVKLLRVLQEREIDRVGGSEPVPVDVRVVAATNRNLRELVARGAFREDLYYRLQGVTLRVPPLRERRQEIPLLVEQFRREAVAAGDARVVGFSTEAIDECFRYPWPGNVRELRNVVFRAVVLAVGELVQRAEVRSILRDSRVAHPLPEAMPPSSWTGEVVEPRPAPPPPAAAVAVAGATEARPIEAAAEFAAEPLAEAATGPLRHDPRPTPAAAAPREERERLTPAPSPSAGDPAPVLEGRLKLLHDLVRARAPLATEEYARIAGISYRTGLRDLNVLVEAGVIVRVGRRRGARYVPAP